jgi:lipopolysaccharide/colanic/teichoic acid biosynthesis glycosyltransferase
MRQRRWIYRGYVKPALDRLSAAVGIVLCAPLLVLVAVTVRWKLGAPVLFVQMRPGKDGRPFRIYKFRTMIDAHSPSGRILPDEQRLSPFGRWLRGTSLDELPELWNVLRGDMSIVGPRPLLMDYVDRYTPEQSRRQEVKPGITGWAQVNGRNSVSWDQRFQHDVWYVENLSLALDLKILALTVISVIAKRGITAETHATMPPFTGQTTTVRHEKAA